MKLPELPRWAWPALVVTMIVCGIIQIAIVVATGNLCSSHGHSMACIGQSCRCVDEVRR